MQALFDIFLETSYVATHILPGLAVDANLKNSHRICLTGVMRSSVPQKSDSFESEKSAVDLVDSPVMENPQVIGLVDPFELEKLFTNKLSSQSTISKVLGISINALPILIALGPTVALPSLAICGTLAVAESFHSSFKKRSDVGERDKDGNTPLILASLRGHLEVVRLLLDRGAKVSESDTCGETPLICASRWGHLEVVRFLLDRGADVGERSNDGDTPLLSASYRGHLEAVRFLLDRGAKVSESRNYGDTPLILASSSGHLEVVRFLLDRGADVGERNNYGVTPLSVAKLYGHSEVIRLLRDRGAKSKGIFGRLFS